jgi:sec-independent protein translocase protein TatB
MFDIGMSEIAVIGVVALVVLGPERLPKVARTAGHMFGRLQRYVATVKSDINREMEMSDLAKMKEEVQSAARSFEQTVNDHAKSIETDARELEKSASLEAKGPENPGPEKPAPTQAELLLEQEAGLPPAAPALATNAPPGDRQFSAPLSVPTSGPAQVSGWSPVQTATQSFDLGIEAPRVRIKS